MANKILVGIIYLLFFVSLLNVSLVSAGWFEDFWNKVSGKAVSETSVISNISLDNITPVSNISLDNVFCADSDKGLNYYVRGQTTNSSEVFDDRCLDKQILEEGYCNGVSIAIQNYECPSRCEDGVCVQVIDGNVTSTGLINESNPTSGIKIALVDENSPQIYITNGRIEIYQSILVGDIEQTTIITTSDTTEGEVFFSLSPGNYSARATVPDYFGKQQSFSIRSNDISEIIMQLKKKPVFNCLALYPNHNGDAKDRINIILIPENVKNIQLFTQRARDIINLGENNTEGLLSDIPLADYKNKFNVFYIDNTNYSGPYLPQDEYCPEIVSNRQYIFLINTTVGIGISNGCRSKLASIGINLDSNDSLKLNNERFVISHEFGHSFGCLFDEYLYKSNYYTSPPESYEDFAGNCASATTDFACSKWCSGKPKSVEELSSTDCTASTLAECSSKWDNGLFCVWENEQCTNLIYYCKTFLEQNDCENATSCTVINGTGDISMENVHKCSWIEGGDNYFNARCIPVVPELNIGNNCSFETGCYATCTNPNWFRSSLNGKMRGGGPFGKIDEEILIERINSYKTSSVSNANYKPDFIFYDKIESNGKILQGVISWNDFIKSQKIANAEASADANLSENSLIIFVENYLKEKDSQNILTNCPQGCESDKKCYPFGFRKQGKFCSDNSTKFIEQMNAESSCENNFECSTNLCIDNKCVNSSLWQKFIKWLNRLF